MPRDLFRLYFNERYQAHREELNGELLTTVSLKVFGANTIPMLVADVRVSAHILSSVPVAENNNELLYAQPGTPIRLQRSRSGRLEITGLNKRGIGNITMYTMPVSITSGSGAHVVVNPGGVSFVSAIGFFVRTITLGELATATKGGFGETPLEALGIFNPFGQFIGFAGGGGGVSNTGSNTIIAPSQSSVASGITSSVTSAASYSTSAISLLVTSLGDSGAGTLRTIFNQAKQLGQACVIKFNVGGSINIGEKFTPLNATDFGHIFIDGRTAPEQVIIDASAVSNEVSTALFQFNAPNNAILDIRVSNAPNAFAIVGDGARDTYFEDIAIHNNDGRGVSDGAIRSFGTTGDNSLIARRIDVTGTSRLRAFEMNGGIHFFASCTASDTQDGFWLARGHETLYQCQVQGNSGFGVLLGTSGNLSMTQTSINNTVFDGIKLQISGTGLTTSGSSPSAVILSSTITNAGVSGSTARHGIHVTEGSRAKVNGSVIKFNYGDGVFVTSTSIVDLGGGGLGASGGNVLKGNGVISGFDVTNSATAQVKAENNIWDHLTVADVSTFDVRGNVDVDPLATSVASVAYTYFVASTGNDGAVIEIGAIFKTIQRAADIASAGDRIFVSAGTYFERVMMKKSGTVNNPIVFQGEENANGDPLVTIDGSDSLGGWVSAPEVGTGVFKTTAQTYVPWMMIADTDKEVWRIADKWMNGATQDIFGGNGGYPVTDGKGVLALAASKTVQPTGAGSAVSFWDGLGALFGYANGTTYCRFADNTDPSTHSVRVSPGPTSKNASPQGACVTIRNIGYNTIQGFNMRGARHAVLIHGNDSLNPAQSNILKNCFLYHGIMRVRLSGNTKNNYIVSNYMEMRSFDVSAYLPAITASGSDWPDRTHQRHLFNVDKFLISGDGGEDDRDVGLHSDGTGYTPQDNIIEGNTMYGGAQAINTANHNGTIFASNFCFAHFSQHVFFFGPNPNYQIRDNKFYLRGQYNLRSNDVNQAGEVYIYRNKFWVPTSSGEHIFLGLLNSVFQDSTMDIWVYHNSFAGATAAFIFNFNTGFGPASLKIVDNIFSTNSVVFNGNPTKMGKYDYNWAYNDSVNESWAGPNRITSVSAMWTPSSTLPDFTVPTGNSARDNGIDLSQSATIQGTLFAPRPGMVVGYGGTDGKPDMGAVQH